MKSLIYTIFRTVTIMMSAVVACVLILLTFSCLKALEWHVIASWIAGGILLTCFVYIIVCNWVMLILSWTTKRFHSVVPLMGSVLGVIGLFLIPVSMPHWSIYFLPIILDCGTVMFVVWGVTEIYKRCRSKKQIELEEK